MKRSIPFFNRSRKAFLAIAIVVSFACGDYIDPNEFMSFFQPEAGNAQPDDQRYFFTPQFYNTDELGEQRMGMGADDQNVSAWSAYVGGNLPDSVISKALYDEDPNAVRVLTARLERTNVPAVAYLDFAWSADNEPNPWEPNAAPVDSAGRLQLLDDAKAAVTSTKDPFLNERYAFQAVRLACETGDYQQAIQLYDQRVKPLPKKTFISDWALCRRAGALLALGDTARAIYDFAQVFDRCPSRREAAETSLRRNGIRFRQAALQYAKTDGERAAVYALCAVQPGQDALDMLNEIVRLTPKNPLIELIMTREINRNEYYFFTTGEQYSYYGATDRDTAAFAERRSNTPSYFGRLRNFALESAENQTLGDAAFWYTAAAYLDYLGKDYEAARTHLDRAAQQPTPNADLKQQIILQQMLLLAAQTETMTPAVETQLLGYLERFGKRKADNFRFRNAFDAVCKTMAATYRQSAPKAGGWLSGCSRTKPETDGPAQAKAYLLTMLPQRASDEYTNASLIEDDTVGVATVRQVIAYANQPNPTDIDKRLLTLANVNNDGLHLLLGRRLMAGYHYAEAADAFAKVNSRTWQNDAFTTYFAENPFGVKMPGEPKANPYTPVTFARRMAGLEQQAKAASGDKAADLYYQLGCGAWNLSWYGNAWLLTKASWSTGEPDVYMDDKPSAVRQRYYDTLTADDYYTTARAGAYFKQAVKSAKTPDLADKAAYMTARCEANAFVLRRAIEQYRNGYVADDDPAFVKRMQALRRRDYTNAYSDLVGNHVQSAFHGAMIGECALYNNFVTTGEPVPARSGQ